MRKVLLFPLLWAVLVASAHAEVDLNSVDKPADAVSAESAKVIQPARNWYAGGAIGLSYLTGWPDTYGNREYFKSYGYDEYAYNSVWYAFWQGGKEGLNKLSLEGKVYGGYRLLESMDIEFGYTRNDNWTSTEDYENYSTGDNIKVERRIRASALYASLAFRPISDGRGHGLYFKLGGHSSELKVSKKITGTPTNLSTIAAGESMPYDGEWRGYGSLYGVGFDFRTARHGAVRLEWSHFNKLGGTPFGKSSINIGYQGDF